MALKDRERALADAVAARRALERVRAQGAVLDGAGPAVVRDGPARGPVVAFVPRVAVPDGRGGVTVQEFAWHCRTVQRRADVFDRMAAQAGRRGGEALGAELVEVGRRYRDLTEQFAAGGLKLQSLDRVGGADGRDFMDVFIDRWHRLRLLHRRIGGGMALQMRRLRPSARGARVSIRNRVLVDMVCLGDLTVSEVLRRHGWSASGRVPALARQALAEALARMTGEPQDVVRATKGVDS